MLWLINSVACVILMYHLLHAGHLASHWQDKATIIGALLLVSAQAIEPRPALHLALICISLSAVLLIWRRPIWRFLKRYFARDKPLRAKK